MKMKQSLILVLIGLMSTVSISAYSQNRLFKFFTALSGVKGPVYRNNIPLTVTDVVTGEKINLAPSTYYRIIDEGVDSILISMVRNNYLKIEKSTIFYHDSATKENVWENIYSIPLNPKPTQKALVAEIGFGTLFLPIKYRFPIKQNGQLIPRNFSTDVSVGPFMGFRFHVGEFADQFMTVGIFAGPSLVRIENKSDSINNQASNLLGFSAGTGFVYSLKNAQVGIIVGGDWLSGADSKLWPYDGKVWMSFAIGYKFLE